jgi:hypothetical protein
LTDESIQILDENKGNFAIMFLPNNTCYGLYDSPFSDKIAELFFEGKIDEIRSKLNQYYQLVVETDEIIPPADYAQANDLPLADALLIQWMRANHFEKKLDPSYLTILGG